MWACLFLVYERQAFLPGGNGIAIKRGTFGYETRVFSAILVVSYVTVHGAPRTVMFISDLI